MSSAGWIVRRVVAQVVALGIVGTLVAASGAAAAAAPFCCDSGGGGYNLALALQPAPATLGGTVQATVSISPATGGGTASFYLGDACQAFCQNQPAPTAPLGSCTPQTVSVAGSSDGECSVSFTASSTGDQGIYVSWTPPGASAALTTEANLSVQPGNPGASGGGGLPSPGSVSQPPPGGTPAPASQPATSSFTDLGGVPWAASQIALLRAQGVVAGVSPTRFAPRGALTGQAAVTLLARLFLPAGSGGPSTPLAGVASWAQAAVAWAESQGIIHNPGTFAPGRPAPRDAVAAWVVRALGLSCRCAPQSALHFADASAIPSAYLQDDTVAAVDRLFVGDAQGDFHPASPINRAEMAVVLVRAEEALADHAANAVPVTWTASPAAGQPGLTLTGTARVRSASLPVGAITGGVLRLQGSGSTLGESFLRWNGTGTATLRGDVGGQPGALYFAWSGGTISGGGGSETYSGSTAAGSLSVQSASNCGVGCAATLSGTLQTSVSGGTETASICGTGGSQCVTYRGPLLPGPALLIADQAVLGLATLVASGGGGPAGPTRSSPATPSGAAPSGSAASGAAGASQDEATVAAMYGDCAAFAPPGQGCQGLFDVASTPDGSGGTLYAVELNRQFGDGTGRGAVFFFDGGSPAGGVGSLPPGTSVQQGQGLGFVAANGVSVPSPGEFAVQFVVSSGPNVCNACVGGAGTDTYVYGWNGSRVTLVSGTPPAPPQVIGGS